MPEDNFPTVIGRPVPIISIRPCAWCAGSGFTVTGVMCGVCHGAKQVEVGAGVAQWHPDTNCAAVTDGAKCAERNRLSAELDQARKRLADFTGKDEAGNPVRVSANGRAAFPAEEYYYSPGVIAGASEWPPCRACGRPVGAGASGPGGVCGKCATRVSLPFPGGAVPVPEPTRAALLLSAKQWSTRVREELHDRHGIWRSSDPVSGALDRLDAVLAELAALEAK